MGKCTPYVALMRISLSPVAFHTTRQPASSIVKGFGLLRTDTFLRLSMSRCKSAMTVVKLSPSRCVDKFIHSHKCNYCSNNVDYATIYKSMHKWSLSAPQISGYTLTDSLCVRERQAAQSMWAARGLISVPKRLWGDVIRVFSRLAMEVGSGGNVKLTLCSYNRESSTNLDSKAFSAFQ